MSAFVSLVMKCRQKCVHGRRLGEGLGGFVPPHRPKVHKFELKSRFMVTLSALLLRLVRKKCEISLCLRRKFKKNTFSLTRSRKTFDSLTFLPLYDYRLRFLCIHVYMAMAFLDFRPPKVPHSWFRPPLKVHILRFVPPPDSSHATPMVCRVGQVHS